MSEWHRNNPHLAGGMYDPWTHRRKPLPPVPVQPVSSEEDRVSTYNSPATPGLKRTVRSQEHRNERVPDRERPMGGSPKRQT